MLYLPISHSSHRHFLSNVSLCVSNGEMTANLKLYVLDWRLRNQGENGRTINFGNVAHYIWRKLFSLERLLRDVNRNFVWMSLGHSQMVSKTHFQGIRTTTSAWGVVLSVRSKESRPFSDPHPTPSKLLKEMSGEGRKPLKFVSPLFLGNAGLTLAVNKETQTQTLAPNMPGMSPEYSPNTRGMFATFSLWFEGESSYFAPEGVGVRKGRTLVPKSSVPPWKCCALLSFLSQGHRQYQMQAALSVLPCMACWAQCQVLAH